MIGSNFLPERGFGFPVSPPEELLDEFDPCLKMETAFFV
jgi:hypothetical protein